MRVNVHKDLLDLNLEQKIEDCLDPCYLSLKGEWSVGEAINHIREQTEEVKLRYFYITDNVGKLIGVISSHLLLIHNEKTPLSKVMDKDTITVNMMNRLKDAVSIMQQHQLVAVPVVDDDHFLKGVVEMQVTPDSFKGSSESSLHLKKTLYNDIFQLMGLSIEDHETKSPIQGFKLRMPWLLGNLLAGLACAAIANYFKLVLETTIILAMFIPLVLTLSESISMQSMTMSLNLLHAKDVALKDVIRKIMIECKTAMLLGLTAGLVVESIAFFLPGNDIPLFIVAISIFASMMITSILGVALPAVLHTLRLDPKIAGGPVVLMFADVFATAIYLGLATWCII
ncbi:MAG: magnesium transporter [Chlamydiota bacterium]